MIRYHNLKEGKPDVNGVVLKVNMAKGVEKRVVNVTGEKQPKLSVDSKQERWVYDLGIEEGLVKLALTKDGGLTIKDMPRNEKVRLYFKEINEATAKKMIEDCNNWNLLVDYVAPVPAPTALDGRL